MELGLNSQEQRGRSRRIVVAVTIVLLVAYLGVVAVVSGGASWISAVAGAVIDDARVSTGEEGRIESLRSDLEELPGVHEVGSIESVTSDPFLPDEIFAEVEMEGATDKTTLAGYVSTVGSIARSAAGGGQPVHITVNVGPLRLGLSGDDTNDQERLRLATEILQLDGAEAVEVMWGPRRPPNRDADNSSLRITVESTGTPSPTLEEQATQIVEASTVGLPSYLEPTRLISVIRAS